MITVSVKGKGYLVQIFFKVKINIIIILNQNLKTLYNKMEKLKKLLISIIIIISINNVSISQTEKSLFFAGTYFQLGQDKEEVLNKINLNIYKLIKIEDNLYMISEYDQKTGYTDIIGHLNFLNGKLLSASSLWVNSESKDTYKSFESLFDILKNIFGDGYSTCDIHVSSFNDSKYERKQIKISLGEKSVYIISTYSKKDSQEMLQISEEIFSR